MYWCHKKKVVLFIFSLIFYDLQNPKSDKDNFQNFQYSKMI